MAAITEDATTIPSRALSLSAPNAVDDLLSNGVCIRCVFRLFGVHGDAYSRPSLTASMLWSYLEEPKTSQTSLCEAADNQNGLNSSGSQKSRDKNSYCCICLGILEFSCQSNQETRDSQEGASVVNFTRTITEQVKGEGHQIDGFTLEISVPPVVVANERAIWLYMKNKYDSEEWFKEKFQCDHISVKDALRLSITSSLENYLNAKSGVDLFRIRLTYTHVEASAELQSLLAKDHGGKKKKTEVGDCKDTVDDISRRESKNSNRNVQNEPDAVIYRALNGLHNSSFYERFMLPQEKAYKPCHLAITCCRTPIYVGGRYLKLSRKVSQSRWIIDDERMGEDSVEEIIGSSTLLICKGDNYKFHAAGREDIDVRMLGSGRPFLVEVSNARHIPLLVDIKKIEDAINNSDKKYVLVRNLKVVGNDAWALMREGEAEKQKQYAALVWIPRPLSEDDLLKISSIKNMDILQRTPIRVLHRRSPLERTRIIHWMKVEKVAGSCQYFLLHLCTQAGTYIKEFVHGDLGRTHPSIGSLLGCRAEILQLDVTDVKMESFD